MKNYNDKQLLELFGQDDQRVFAFEQIVRLYSPRIYWTVRKIVVSHHDTDDIVQSSMLKLWQSLADFRGESSIYTWLYRIAVNLALSHIRERNRTATHIYSGDDVSAFDNILADDNLFDADATEIALQRAINSLPPKQKAVFIMRYYDEVPFKEIAEIMELSEGAVKSSYHIAREKVETQIKLLLE